jgi:hypothetical protein
MRRIFVLIPIFITMLACGVSESLATPTPAGPNPAEIAATMLSNQMAAAATSQAVGLQFTATANVIGVTQTQQAGATQRADAQATSDRQRIDAQATSEQQRRDAQATAEQKRVDIAATQQRIDADATQQRMDAQATQQRMDAESTQSAEATATRFALTQAVIPLHNSWTQAAIQQDIIMATNEVEMSNLKVKQQQQTNTVEWAVPMSIAIFAALVLAIWLYNQSQVREVKNGDGDIELIIFKNRQGIRPKLLPGPVLELAGETTTMPMLVSSTEQSEVTKHAQAVEALAAMPVSPANNAVTAFNQTFGKADDKPFEVIDGNAVPAGLLDAEALKSIEKDWDGKDD